MKITVVILLTSLLFSSCDLFMSATQKKDEGNEPPYTAKVVWHSDLMINYHTSHMVDGDSVYFYEQSASGSYLTKIDAETGKLIWRSSKKFGGILYCPPIASDRHIFVLFEPNLVVCFDKETGICTAVVSVDTENRNLELAESPALYKEYLYLNLWSRPTKYFTRLDINKINHTGDQETIQELTPEIIWKPNNGAVCAAPVISNNIIYTSTYTFGSDPLKSVELAGFDTDTKEMVFYQTFGGADDGDVPNPESGSVMGNPIFIHDNILYYLNRSIAAWNIKTGEQLYRHVFDRNTPKAQRYGAAGSLQAMFYKDKIYYTNATGYDPDSYRNIHCIEAATGKLVWNAIAIDSYTLEINPIIAHDKLYVSQSNGFQVYDPETGELLGMDKSFCGADMARSILYKDYMICVRWDEKLDGYLVAVDVGK